MAVSDTIYKKRKAEYNWLRPKTDGALCSVCSEYYKGRALPKGNDETFILKPFNNWKKVLETMLKITNY